MMHPLVTALFATGVLALMPFAACAAPPAAPFDLAVDGATPDDTLLTADARSVALVQTGEPYTLTLVDRTTHAIAWTKPLPGWAPSPPAFHGDEVLAMLHDGRLLAFRRADGNLAWQAQLGAKLFGNALVDGDTLYVGAGHDLLAVDLAAHSVRWRAPLSPKWNAEAAPVRDGARLYLLVGEDLIALDAATGAVAWRHPTTTYAGGDYDAPVLVAGDRVVTGTATKKLVAVAADSGESAWEAAPKNHTWSDRLVVTPYLFGDRVCFSHVSLSTLVEGRDRPSGEFDARATCVDLASGVTRWSIDLPLGDSPRSAGVAAAAGKLWILHAGKLIGFDPDDGDQTSLDLPDTFAKLPSRLAAADEAGALVLGRGRLAQVRLR